MRLDSTVLPSDLYISSFLSAAVSTAALRALLSTRCRGPYAQGDGRETPRMLVNLYQHGAEAELVHFMYPIVDKVPPRSYPTALPCPCRCSSRSCFDA